MNKIHYRHTQAGFLLIMIIGVAIVALGMVSAVYGANPVTMVVSLVLLAALLAFRTLTVEIDDELLRMHFGGKLFRKSIPLRDVDSVRVVKTPWFYGWGLKWSPHGWVYRVSGLMTVEVRLKNGRRYRIGSDEPEKLAGAIRESRREKHE